MTAPSPVREEDGWLAFEIEEATKEMKRWPKWMRLAAQFEERDEAPHD